LGAHGIAFFDPVQPLINVQVLPEGRQFFNQVFLRFGSQGMQRFVEKIPGEWPACAWRVFPVSERQR